MFSSPDEERSALALGCDIGGSRTKLGLVDSSGRIVAFREFATSVSTDGVDPFIRLLLSEMDALLMRESGRVIGVGISFLGWINEERTGPIFCMNAPALHGFNFRALMEDHFHLPVCLHDDVTAHTLAEYTFGAGKATQRFLCLAMGTGLGAGVIVNGRSLDFTGGCAGDTGHILLRPEGPACASGCRGCAEALIGTAGIERLAREKYQLSLTAGQIIQAAADGKNPQAVSVMGEVGLLTGELLASLFPIFVPERIVLAGGTARAGAVLLRAARERFEHLAGGYCRSYARISKYAFTVEDIVLGDLLSETGVVGAVVDIFRDIERDTTL